MPLLIALFLLPLPVCAQSARRRSLALLWRLHPPGRPPSAPVQGHTLSTPRSSSFGSRASLKSTGDYVETRRQVRDEILMHTDTAVSPSSDVSRCKVIIMQVWIMHVLNQSDDPIFGDWLITWIMHMWWILYFVYCGFLCVWSKREGVMRNQYGTLQSIFLYVFLSSSTVSCDFHIVFC
jgi:hypothetical protein